MGRRRHRSACCLRQLLPGLVATLSLVVGLAPAAHAAAPGYVALGDSYSSGVGAGDYISDSGDCLRSTNSYPELWSQQQESVSFTFAACSGATTADVGADQLGSLDAGTSLVTISVGGNDAGFAEVMSTCVSSSESTCLDRVEQSEEFIRTELPARLDGLYATLRKRAPNAEVVVFGYPRIYELSGSCWVGLSETKRAAVNSGSDALAEVTEERATYVGATFVDLRDLFSGHEICSGDPWLHSVNWANIAESYHPTTAGQADGYLPELVSVTGQAAHLRTTGHQS